MSGRTLIRVGRKLTGSGGRAPALRWLHPSQQSDCRLAGYCFRAGLPKMLSGAASKGAPGSS